MSKTKYGLFCKLYGKTLRNKVLEYMLEMGELDFAVGDLAEETDISRPKAYDIIEKLEKEGIVKKTRKVSKTRLYSLDHTNKKVELLEKSFHECLKIAVGDVVKNPLKELESSIREKPITKQRFIEMRKQVEIMLN